MSIDHELRDALRRTQAPADLADRVLARINETPTSHTQSRSNAIGSNVIGSNTVLRWLAAAAVVTLTVGGAEQYYTRQKAAEAARVQDEIRIALQITNDTLVRVQSKLSQPVKNGNR